MNLIILHGNGLSAIASKLITLKKGFEPLAVLSLSSREKDFATALMEISTGQLFSQKRLVVLEDFDDIDLNKLPEDENLTLVLRFPKDLGEKSPLLKEAYKRKAQILLLSEEKEKNIFPFLDELAEKNSQSVKKLNKLLDEYGGQYVLTMIFYLLRRLLMSPKKLPAFVVQKINKQKQNFSENKIKELYQFALETDFKIKTGATEEKLGLTLLVDKILKT